MLDQEAGGLLAAQHAVEANTMHPPGLREDHRLWSGELEAVHCTHPSLLVAFRRAIRLCKRLVA